MKISLIAAMGRNREIGFKGEIPWHLPKDFKHFKETTMGHHIVMGRKTYESIGRLLPGRTTIILTNQRDYKVEGAVIKHDIADVIDYAKLHGEDELFICGGGEVYNCFKYLATDMYLSHVDFDGDADAYFPEYDLKVWDSKTIALFGAEPEKGRPEWNLAHYTRV